nr:MauE/DoxX family redox-associated membrane protein [Pedobacter panaciterrae]
MKKQPKFLNLKAQTILIEVISALYIILFIYAALSKVQDFQKFKVELGKSPILNGCSNSIAVVVPGIELTLSVLLAMKRFQYYALYCSFCLMVIFSTYIIAILKFSSFIPCSCGGILQNMTWTQHLIFNLCFVCLAAAGILIYSQENKDLTRDKKGSLHP